MFQLTNSVDDGGCGNNVGIFGVYIHEMYCVRCLGAVETSLFNYGHAIIVAECVENGSAHAATGGRPAYDQGVRLK